MEKRKSKFRKIGGIRSGRNVCIGSRITDEHDEMITEIAERENKTRSKIVSDAIHEYLKQKEIAEYLKQKEIAEYLKQKEIAVKNFSIVVEMSEDGVFIASVPSIKDCYTYGQTIDDLISNLKEVISTVLRG